MGRMCPPQSVKRCRTPASLSVRATRCPPVRSLMSVTPCAGNVRHLELQAIGILEEHGVVAGSILGEVARRAVERRQTPGGEKLVAESIHVFSPRYPERDVVDADALSMKAAGRVSGIGRDQPEVRRAVREACDVRFFMNDPVLQIPEQILVKRQGARGITDVQLHVIEGGLHQNFSHFTLFLSIPFRTRTSRTCWMVSPPPHT